MQDSQQADTKNNTAVTEEKPNFALTAQTTETGGTQFISESGKVRGRRDGVPNDGPVGNYTTF